MSVVSATPLAESPVVFGDPQLHTDGDLVALAFAADGSLWSVEEPGVVRHWDTASGRQLGHQQLSDLETLWGFSGDGRLLAAASNDLAIWETAGGRLLAALPQPEWVTAVAFGPNPTVVATGHDDGSVHVWDAAGQTLVRTLTLLQRAISSIAFSPDGQRLAFASEGKTIVIARLGDGESVCVLTGHTDRIPQLAWLGDGRVVSASWDGTARVWDTATGQPVLVFNTHESQVVVLAVSADGRFLATGDASGNIHVWQCPEMTQLHALATSAGELRCLAFSADGRQLACGGNDQRIHLWDVASGQPRAAGSALGRVPTSLAVSGDGALLVTNEGGRACRVWDTSTRQPLRTLTDVEAVSVVAVSTDGRWAAGAAGRAVRVWDAHTGQCRATLADHDELITVLAFAPDSRTLAAASNNGMSVWLWDIGTAEPLLLIPDALDGCAIHALAFHPDGRRLAVGGIDWMATGGSDGSISLWDIAQRCEVATFGTGTTALAFHPSGDHLLSATLDHALLLWDIATEDDIAEFDGHDATVNAIAFSPDGRRAVSGGDDRTVRVWNAGTGDLLAVRELDTQIKALAFGPDGRQVYTANGNTTCYRIRV